jgi:hypothetical protein
MAYWIYETLCHKAQSFDLDRLCDMVYSTESIQHMQSHIGDFSRKMQVKIMILHIL